MARCWSSARTIRACSASRPVVQGRGAFEASFRGFIGDWLKSAAPTAPIVMAGMVGSKLGWREAPYVATPVQFEQLAGNLIALPDLDGHPIRIAPGASAREDGRPDVMRGEECQLYGLC